MDPEGDPSRDLVPLERSEPTTIEDAVLVETLGVVDTVVGAAMVATKPVVVLAQRLLPLSAPIARVVANPPLVPSSLTLGALLRHLREVGTGGRIDVVEGLDAVLRRRASALLIAALERVNITEVVLATVDLPRVVDAALDSVDLTAVVVDRVDLGRVVDAALDSVDLTGVVVDRVDLVRVVNVVLDRLDLTALVRERVDLAALADEVIDEVDLPDIIRDSSTGVATDVVEGARMSAIAGDDLVAKWVDRVMLRRRARKTDAPGDPESAQDLDEPEAKPDHE